MRAPAHRRSILPTLRLLAVLAVLAGCGGSDDAPAPQPPPPTDPPPTAPPPPSVGLDARPANATCRAGDAPSTATGLAIERVFPQLPAFSVPVLMLQEPASSERWYVMQKTGVIHVFDNQPAASTTRTYFDASGLITASPTNPNDERGLLGMAFHPGYATNRRVFLSYTATAGGQLVSRVVEFTASSDGSRLEPGSARVLLQVNQPQANHNGGHIAFGADGLLYIGLGDGGGGGDQFGAIGNGQRLSTLLGKVLRIDVEGSTGATPYRIPADNPYAGNAVCNNDTGAFTQSCPEIYAYGFRNPWRWSFDRGSGELWLGDVGQGAWEEVNRVVRGGNYGWRCREGAHAFNSSCGPNAANSLDPVAEYARGQGFSVTGGHVYRGSAVPLLSGRYVFGDFGSGRLWHIARDTPPTLQVTAGFDTGLAIAAFAEDRDGELYVVHYGGTLHRLVPATGAVSPVPTQLSATGCLDTPGLIGYAPNAPFWSDGADKARALALPDGRQIGIDAAGDFQFPDGSVLVKHFSLGGRRIETRLFMRHTNGEWAGYTYEWNQAGTDATRVTGGKVVQVGAQQWLYPSEAQCLLCHTQAAGRTLGLEVAQLNGEFTYPQTGRRANQLATLDAVSVFSAPLSPPPSQQPTLPDPYGNGGTLAERARAWLHTNCSHCHRPGGVTNSGMDLRYTTALAATNACEVTPVRDLGVAGARLIAVGGADAAARSLVVLRAERTDTESMPPLQPRRVDAAGVALLREWIGSLASCN